jgi:Protein of unknown function (DUF1553)/Protein of unknown function (DUF1549)/Planctomycete cytochrome C
VNVPPAVRLAAVVTLLTLAGLARAEEKPSPALADFFEKEIRPLLVERCVNCHGGEKTRGGLTLTSRASLLEGGDHGPAAVPGDPDKSLLLQAVRQTGKLKMPPKEQLADAEVDKLARWVKLGLPWPDADKLGPATRPGQDYVITEEQRKFWSFQPVKPVPPPAVKDTTWPRCDIDRFLLAALEAKGLKPAPPADKRTLLRRATFDLTGLPPMPEEVDAFLKDESPGAFARVVDRLLASPAYGERWGRHWLDVARYTDSFDARILSGDGNTMDVPAAWRYRDWVVDAFNRDLPYDQFVIHQVAGDLLPSRDGGVNVEGTIATGLLAIGNWGGGDADKEKLLTDIADDQIDLVGRGFLGLTLACARCHDHKFDPIPTEDYYSLAGIFMSTHILENPGPKTNGPPMLRIPLETKEQMAKRTQHAARVAELEKLVQQTRDSQREAAARALLPQTERYLNAAWAYRQGGHGQSVGEFAAARKLDAEVLRRWLDYLGLGDYRLMTTPVSKVQGKEGLFGWKGAADNPSATINTTDKELAFLTIKMPPKTVAVHPGPSSGVAAAWRSPISGTVQVSGRVLDADGVCGDGIDFAVRLKQPGGVRELVTGSIPNGGAAKLSEGKGADSLASIEVKAGDVLLLVVLPKADYTCDTTVVELEVAEKDGKRTWSLTKDVVADPLEGGKGNPHSDGFGNREVWHFYDLADVKGAAVQAPPDSALAKWQAAAAKDDRAAVEKASAGVLQALASMDVLKGPDAALYKDLLSPRSPYWPSTGDDKALPAEARDQLAKLTAELDELKKNLASPPAFAHGVQEDGCPQSPQEGIHNVRVHVRGRYDRLGKEVPRRFPRILAGDDQTPIAEGSGRLQLAKWIASPDNPLTARVMVNRVWQHHFGEGLVRTPGNFGKLGQPPTHPELLDHLATLLVKSGWSLKALHREIMLSAAYQQSSSGDPQTQKADPDNLLVGRQNRQRLEAEAIRDSLLEVAGRLDRRLGGPASRDFELPRRTLYFMTVRSDRTSFRELFDAADPTAIIDKRVISTVAPQALWLMNHPFAGAQAKALAQRIVDGGGDDRAKVERLYLLLYGRPPREREVDIGMRLARQGWEGYCQVLLCANEFVYVD